MKYDVRPITTSLVISPLWVTGITDAEGNFSINYQVKSNKVHASFKVTQKSHSLGILLSLQSYFSCGKVCLDNRKQSSHKFQVDKVDDLLNIIIPHFRKYKLLTSKGLDFIDFEKAVVLFKDGSRSTNMDAMFSLKNEMNTKRDFYQR